MNDRPVGTPRSARALVVGVNDLATSHPGVAAQWDFSRNEVGPQSLKAGSNKPVWWRCERNDTHCWQVSPNARIKRSSNGTETIRGCPFCAGRRLVAGVNDLASRRPELMSSWDSSRNERPAQEYFASTSTKLWWRCERDDTHRWAATPATPANRAKQGCPFCSGRRVVAGMNDLAGRYPQVAAQLHPSRNGGLCASQVAAFSHRAVWWQCPYHHEHVYDMPVAKRTQGGQGCPYCAGRRVLVGSNDLATLDPGKAARWHPERNGLLGPHQVSVGSDRRVWWRCDELGCGAVWQGYVYAPNACPKCECFTSLGQKELTELVVDLLPAGEQVYSNIRGVLLGTPRAELDVLVPSRGLALEFNGVYWHAQDKGHGRCSHWDKYRACRSAGLELVTVWSDDWASPVKKQVLTQMVARKLGVSTQERLSARSLTVDEACGGEVSLFLGAYHLQGATVLHRSFVLRDQDGRVVALLGVRHGAKGSRTGLGPGQWEIRRYATAAVVRGGFSRLLRHAERVLAADGQPVRQWVSFAAHEVSTGGLYRTNGFRPASVVGPDYSYAGSSTGWARMNKQNFTKQRFALRADLRFEPGLGEQELAALNGLVRVWDSGKTRWVKDVSTTRLR